MTKFRFGVILLLVVVFFDLCGVDCHAQDAKRWSPEHYFRIGEQQVEKGHWLDARNSFDECLFKNHEYVEAYLARAIVHEHLDSLNQALVDYSIYLEYFPAHHEALFGRAQVRMRLEQYALAKDDLFKLLRTPGDGETTSIYFRQDVYAGGVDKIFTMQSAEKGLVYNLLGQADIKILDYQEAVLYFDSALRATPNDPDVLVNRGTAKEKMLDTTAAIFDYQRALMYNPGHAAAKHNLASIGKGRNTSQTKSQLYDEAIDDSPNMPQPYAQRAYDHYQKGEYAKALKDYDHAIALDHSEPEYFLARGMTKERLKDPRSAYDDYTAAIKLRIDFDKAYLNRGNILIKLDLYKEAVDDYTKAIMYSPANSSAYFNRALAFSYLKQNAVACDDLKKAEQLGAKIQLDIKENICK